MSIQWVWEIDSLPTDVRADRAILMAMEAGQGSWVPETAERPSVSRSLIQKLMQDGHVLSGSQAIEPSSKLKPGMQITVRFPAPRKMELTPEDRPIETLYEDEHLLVLNKPPGLTVHPSTTQAEGTLVHALLHHVKDLSGIGGVLRPGIVHRLDKDTSGALVITKTDTAHHALVRIFSAHEIEREYWALCYGAPKLQPGKEMRIESLIGRNPKDRKKMSSEVKTGRRAVTRIELRELYSKPSARAPFASWIRARLETGRTHQVRVHLTAQGCSLLGDPVYGTPTTKQAKWVELPEDIRSAVKNLPGQALHARVLGFTHPVTGQAIRVEAPPPPAFRLLLEALTRYAVKAC